MMLALEVCEPSGAHYSSRNYNDSVAVVIYVYILSASEYVLLSTLFGVSTLSGSLDGQQCRFFTVQFIQ